MVVNALAAVANPTSAPANGDPGVVRRFLAWASRASAEERADGFSALARAYLHSDLTDSLRAESVIALTSALDDPSALVRRALAEAFAGAADAPRHIVLALARDQSDVACVVLARSPAIDDAELVDCVAIGDTSARIAIARRARLSAGVAAAIAEVGETSAAIALAGNLDADIGPNVLRRLFERFGEDARVREALLDRDHLPVEMRAQLAAAAADALARCAASHEWLNPGRADRIAREAREQAFVSIALSSSEAQLAELVAWLRKSGALTVALLMRALMSGDSTLLRQSLVEMSGLPERRVAGFLRDWRGQGFASLYAKAGLPAHFLPAFRAALGALAADPASGGGQISYALTSRVIRACEELASPALAPILAMLWRFAGEGAREDAREYAAEAVVAEPAPRLPLIEPEAWEDEAPPVLLLDVEGANENFAPAVELDLEPPEEAAIADAA
jgi:uncharacterized protein (DUF2336 family)